MPVGRGPRSLLSRLSTAEWEDLMAPLTPPRAREPNVVLLRWCLPCAGYMREGSAAAGRCVDCGAPRH